MLALLSYSTDVSGLNKNKILSQFLQREPVYVSNITSNLTTTCIRRRGGMVGFLFLFSENKLRDIENIHMEEQNALSKILT